MKTPDDIEDDEYESSNPGDYYPSRQHSIVKPLLAEEVEVTNHPTEQQNTTIYTNTGNSLMLYLKAAVIFYFAAVDLLSYTIIQPFLPQYLLSKFPDTVNEDNSGTYVGVILGTFFVARFFSNTFIGHLSDRVGRKVLMIVSLLVSTIATGAFTFLPTIWLVIVFRMAHGFFSATSALSKVMLIDISTGNNIPVATRSLLFAYLGSTFAMSRAASSAMGGIIVGIGAALKSKNPYLIACIVATILIFVGFIFSLIMPETHTIEARELNRQQELVSADSDKEQKSILSKLYNLFFEKTRSKLFIMFLINSMCNASCFLMWVLVSQADVDHGGFSFDSLRTGFLFAIYGVFAVGFQLLFFKRVMTYFNLLKTFKIGSVFQMAQNTIFAFIVMVNRQLRDNPAQPYVLWTLLTVFCLITAMGFMMTLNVLQSMIVNATDKTHQGLVQGVSESIATAARAIGPIIFGYLLSQSIVVFNTSLPVSLLLILLYGLSMIISVWLEKKNVDN
ncbi:tetA [Acrasis kona]|uniref:TetA n=1 Tax=Acrasis kona TaxID=1008807 RepID=A0AAW2YTM5_9EUKA